MSHHSRVILLEVVPLFVLALFCLYFFRDPDRGIPSGPVAVSPADGKVVAVKTESPTVTRISIFLNIFDVHVNRIPCDGTVENIVYQPGRFVAANRPDATISNEQNAVMIRAADGGKVLCVQVAGLIARRIVCWTAIGEKVACGERFGLIRFGSRVDLFLPRGSSVSKAVGDRVKGGTDVVARLPRGEEICAERS